MEIRLRGWMEMNRKGAGIAKSGSIEVVYVC